MWVDREGGEDTAQEGFSFFVQTSLGFRPEVYWNMVLCLYIPPFEVHRPSSNDSGAALCYDA